MSSNCVPSSSRRQWCWYLHQRTLDSPSFAAACISLDALVLLRPCGPSSRSCRPPDVTTTNCACWLAVQKKPSSLSCATSGAYSMMANIELRIACGRP